MTGITMSIAPPATAERQPPVLPNLLRSEWAKLASVRSTYWSVAAAVAGMVVIGIGGAVGAARAATQPATFDPVSATIGGFVLAQVALGVLGVLAVTSEYSTGMIRSTFTAAPQRATVIAAKAAVFGAASFAVGAGVTLLTFLAGQVILGDRGVGLGAPGALRAVIGVGLYLGLLGVLAVGLGTIIRRSAGAIAVLLGLLFVLPALAPLAPTSIRTTVAKLLPYNAGQAIFNTAKSASMLSPSIGLAVFALYATAALAIATILVRRRDAWQRDRPAPGGGQLQVDTKGFAIERRAGSPVGPCFTRCPVNPSGLSGAWKAGRTTRVP